MALTVLFPLMNIYGAEPKKTLYYNNFPTNCGSAQRKKIS